MTNPEDICLPKGYKIRHNNKHWDDRNFGDEWQRETYETARTIAKQMKAKTVLDLGCGSGFKLMKYFVEFETVGIELDPCLSMLLKKYPDRKWFAPWEYGKIGHDIAICSDVIEHLPDPTVITDSILHHDPKVLVLSTPIRINMGPPKNPCHCMEWLQDELHAFMEQELGYFYEIESKAISGNKFGRRGKRQATLIIGRRK